MRKTLPELFVRSPFSYAWRKPDKSLPWSLSDFDQRLYDCRSRSPEYQLWKSPNHIGSAGYTRIRMSVNSPRDADRGSVDGSRGLQVYLLPIALYDALPDLSGCLSLLVHAVGVIQLFQANRALGPVAPLKTAMKTIVAHPAVAVAVAGLLMQNDGNFGRQFVGVTLKRVLRIRAPELFAA
jgi:hypothetical protein